MNLVIVATPGTGAIFTIAAVRRRGRRASLIAALGCTLGTVPHLAAAVTGLAAVLHASAVAFSIIEYAGVAQRVEPEVDHLLLRVPTAVRPAERLRRRPTDAGPVGVFMLMTLVVFAGYGVFAAGMRSMVLDRPRVVTWLRRIFAGTYVALACRLALRER